MVTLTRIRVEASTERVLDHLRGPFPSRADLLTEDAGNTVSEIDPARLLGLVEEAIEQRWQIYEEIASRGPAVPR
jgi:hypothetical protein